MKNKYVGLMIIGIALIFFLVVMSFNNALESIVNANCTHGKSCSMYTTLKTQKVISYSLMGLLVLVGFFISFLFREEKPPLPEVKKILSEEEKKKLLEGMDEEEKAVINLVFAREGSIYQSDLIKETSYSKVKVTRILDKLEGKSLIERKRRGMTNIIILK